MTHPFGIAIRSYSKESEHGPLRIDRVQLCTLLFLVISITPCMGLDKPKERVSGVTTSTTALPQRSLPSGDPQFVEAREVFSTHGPQSITRNLLQDRKGNYWFATWEGIVLYDGKFFTNVTLMAGLKHFHVFSVLEDRKGNIWFGTIRGGVYRYDGKTFTLFTTADGLASNVVTCMLEDKTGNIWFGTDGGVSRYDGRRFANFTTQDGLRGNSVHTITQDKTGKLWFGTNGGVSWYEPLLSSGPGVGSFTDFANPGGYRFSNVRSIVEDRNGLIWIGSGEGLRRYDGKSVTKLSTAFTTYILEDRRGNLWLSEGTADGRQMTLSRFDGRSFTRKVTSAQIFGIIEDRIGNIWFGTESGVCRYDGKSLTFCSEQLE